MKRLCIETLREVKPSEADAFSRYPVRVLQVGSGNFLRAFAGWMVDRMNRQGVFGGRIAVTQATPSSRTAALINEQDGWYTVLSRGLVGGQPAEQVDLVGSVSRGLNPYAQWRDLLALAADPHLRFVVSNTTEAGIAYSPAPQPLDQCPPKYPAQLAALLYERYRRSRGDPGAGLVMLPCELIERNGHTLQRLVMQHAADWRLDKGFTDWLNAACRFANTLVDRIVPGLPADEIDALRERLGYDDRLLVAAEWYHSWVIEGDADLAREWPLAEAGLNVTWTDDLTPFRTRKVRLLNGAHTLMAAPALLAGLDTVRQCVEDPLVGQLVRHALFEEIVPTLDLPPAEATAFAQEVLTRFRNPYIAHRLTSIALNGISKWRVRVLPSLEAHLAWRRRLPEVLTFSLAALVALYRGAVAADGVLVGRSAGRAYGVRDEADVLNFLARAWSDYDHAHDLGGLCRSLLGSKRLWGRDLNELPGLTERVTGHLDTILQAGMVPAIQQVLKTDG